MTVSRFSRPPLILVLILGFVATMLTLALMYETGFFRIGVLAPAEGSNAMLSSFHDGAVSRADVVPKSDET